MSTGAGSIGSARQAEDHYARLSLEILRTERLPMGSRSTAELLQDWGIGREPQEIAVVVAYDLNSNIRTVVEVARGGHASMDVNIPCVLTAVLGAGANLFALAHNHPSIDVLPSVADVHLTNAVMAAANACGIQFEEHLILGPTGDFFSFVDAGMLVPVPRGGGRRAKVPSRIRSERRDGFR